jgi:hypothetical protein
MLVYIYRQRELSTTDGMEFISCKACLLMTLLHQFYLRCTVFVHIYLVLQKRFDYRAFVLLIILIFACGDCNFVWGRLQFSLNFCSHDALLHTFVLFGWCFARSHSNLLRHIFISVLSVGTPCPTRCCGPSIGLRCLVSPPGPLPPVGFVGRPDMGKMGCVIVVQMVGQCVEGSLMVLV